MKRLLPFLAVLLSPAPALAEPSPSPAACLGAYEQGQVSRLNGHFEEARASFATCTTASCPMLVRERCMDFSAKLEAEQPTVIVAVRDETGGNVRAATVSIDGAEAIPVQGDAIRLDPGPHTFRAEAVERRLTLRLFDKNQRVELVVARPSSKPGAERERGALPWVLAGTSGIALLAAGGLSIAGWSVHSDLASSCSPGCTDDDVATLRTLWAGSFVALGVGVVSGIAAALVFRSSRVRHDAIAMPTIRF